MSKKAPRDWGETESLLTQAMMRWLIALKRIEREAEKSSGETRAKLEGMSAALTFCLRQGVDVLEQSERRVFQDVVRLLDQRGPDDPLLSEPGSLKDLKDMGLHLKDMGLPW